MRLNLPSARALSKLMRYQTHAVGPSGGRSGAAEHLVSEWRIFCLKYVARPSSSELSPVQPDLAEPLPLSTEERRVRHAAVLVRPEQFS